MRSRFRPLRPTPAARRGRAAACPVAANNRNRNARLPQAGDD